MNGYTSHDLGPDFEEPSGSAIKAFDAFPKTKPHYLTRTQTGGPWTLILILASTLLIFTETRRWFAGSVNHAFTVEKGVSHQLQINVDVVVAMQCHDLHVNVQDASGDRIMAGETLKKDPTNWARWGKSGERHRLAGTTDDVYGLEEEDVHDYLGLARRGRRKFSKTPKVRGNADACRLYGSLEGNKVQGDFHITARGHGYLSFDMHLDHSLFNFSHHVNELSFGPYYPSLINPLDNTVATTEANFYKFQYYANIVPTIYTTDVHRLSLSPHSTSSDEPLTNVDDAHYGASGSTVWTNQYAVTEQSHAVPETSVPGVFFKYDIEPILLVVNEERGGLLALIVRLINVVSGVLVAGHWLLQFTDFVFEHYQRGQAGGRERLGFLGTRDEKFV